MSDQKLTKQETGPKVLFPTRSYFIRLCNSTLAHASLKTVVFQYVF